MEKFSAKNNDKYLTLAFEKAATQETRIFHPWRYFVAGGETLQQIETVINDFGTVAQAYVDLAKKVGAKSYDGSSFSFDFQHDELKDLTGSELTDNGYSGGAGSEPWQCARIERLPGWVVTNNRAYGHFIPDVSTPEGRAVRDECKALKERAQPLARFANWLGASAIEVPQDYNYPNGQKIRASATATKIGDEWIVAVPVKLIPEPAYNPTSLTEEWVIPPGSQPLNVGEYFARLENKGLLRNTPKP